MTKQDRLDELRDKLEKAIRNGENDDVLADIRAEIFVVDTET